MEKIQNKISELQRLSRELLSLGKDADYVYAEDLCLLNREVLRLSDEVFKFRGKTIEQEASLCFSLLMGYGSTMSGGIALERKKQEILDRCWKVLNRLPDSLLKCQLLVYCYGEVYEEELAREAHRIMESWCLQSLSPEETELKETLHIFEENPYPHWDVSDNKVARDTVPV